MTLGIGFPGVSHDLYLSVTEIEISETKEIAMVVKVFSDDLYSSMLSNEPDIISEESNWDKKEVSSYIKEKISLKSGGAPVHVALLEVTVEGESTFLHFKGEVGLRDDRANAPKHIKNI